MAFKQTKGFSRIVVTTGGSDTNLDADNSSDTLTIEAGTNVSFGTGDDTLIINASPSTGSANVIAPFTYASMTDSPSSGSGTGLSWTYDSSSSKFTVTFDTAQSDTSYTVVTDEEFADGTGSRYMMVTGKSTTGFDVEMYGSYGPSGDPKVVMVFGSSPVVSVGGIAATDYIQDSDGDTGVQVDDGSAGDTDTVSIMTAGSERMRVTSDGKVAIGLAAGTSPSRMLDVNGSVKFRGGIILGSHASKTAISMDANSVVTLPEGLTIGQSSGYSFPTSDGTSGQVLVTDGAGALTFTTPSGGSGGGLTATSQSVTFDHTLSLWSSLASGGSGTTATWDTGLTIPSSAVIINIVVTVNTAFDGIVASSYGYTQVRGPFLETPMTKQINGTYVDQYGGNSTTYDSKYLLHPGTLSSEGAFFWTSGNLVMKFVNQNYDTTTAPTTGSATLSVYYLA